MGVHANSRLEVRNNQGAQRFPSPPGVDDSAADQPHAVTFAV